VPEEGFDEGVAAGGGGALMGRERRWVLANPPYGLEFVQPAVFHSWFGQNLDRK
jgi:hypothetical protein